MADETNDFADEAEIDRVEPSDSDDSQDWNYYDPEEDQDDVAEPETNETDEETDEDVTQEAEDDQEADEEAEEQAEPEAFEGSDDTVVALADGSKVTLGELKESPMFKADHTRKTQELTQLRKTVEADASQLKTTFENIVDRLAQFAPPDPDTIPHQSFEQYQAAKAAYNNFVGLFQGVTEAKDAVEGVSSQMQEHDQQAAQQQTQAALAQKFPQISTREGFNKFMGEVSQGASAAGFTNEDLQAAFSMPKGAALIELAYWANQGKAAEKAKKAVKAKAQKAPPAKPVKPGQAGRQANRNREAMQKLSRSGSIADALKVDWD